MERHARYFDGKLNDSFMTLVTGRLIIYIASGLLGLFLPIFLFNLFGGDYVKVFLYYGLGSLLYVLFLPLGIKYFDEKIGYQRSLRLSLIFAALFYVILFFVDKETMMVLIPLSMIVLVIHRTLFWVPFKTDLAKLTDSNNRGRQMSFIEVIRMILAAVLPLVAAFLINSFSYDVVFVIAIGIYLLTLIPFSKLPHSKEDFSWGYKRTFSEFLHAVRKKKVAIAFLADGAETFVSFIIWPIFIFELLDGNFLEVGIITSFITIITIVLQLVSGKVIDKNMSKKRLLKIGTLLYSFGWILKMFILTAFHVFVAGTYHSIVKIFTRTPYDTLNYDLSSKEGHYIDEYTVVMDMAIHSGRVIMMIVSIILIQFLSIEFVFILAAIASLLLNLMREQDLYFKKGINI